MIDLSQTDSPGLAQEEIRSANSQAHKAARAINFAEPILEGLWREEARLEKERADSWKEIAQGVERELTQAREADPKESFGAGAGERDPHRRSTRGVFWLAPPNPRRTDLVILR